VKSGSCGYPSYPEYWGLRGRYYCFTETALAASLCRLYPLMQETLGFHKYISILRQEVKFTSPDPASRTEVSWFFGSVVSLLFRVVAKFYLNVAKTHIFLFNYHEGVYVNSCRDCSSNSRSVGFELEMSLSPAAFSFYYITVIYEN